MSDCDYLDPEWDYYDEPAPVLEPRGRRWPGFWRLVALLQPAVLLGMLLAPFVLYAWLQAHQGWLSVWQP